MKKYIEPLKVGTSLVVSIGVGAIVGNLAMSNIPVDVSRLTRTCITIGKWALAGIAADKASKYVEDKIDEAVTVAEDIIYGKDKEITEEEET